MTLAAESKLTINIVKPENIPTLVTSLSIILSSMEPKD